MSKIHSPYLLVLIGLLSAGVTFAQPRADVQSLGDDLQVRRLSAAVWVFTLRGELKGGGVRRTGW